MKKFLPNYPLRLHILLKNLLSNWAIQNKIPNKIERLNTYANSHKKQTAIITISLLSLLLVIGVLLTLSSQESTNIINESSPPKIEDISSIIAKKQRIEEIKLQQVNDTKSLITQGQSIRKELDSLMQLPVKVHQDSLEIYRKHKQLEIIVRHIKTYEED